MLYPLRNALQYQKALETALLDSLTGIPNRAAFDQAIQREVELAGRHKLQFSLLAIDLDKFKSINDTRGHAAGDEVLRQVVGTIESCIRKSDMLFRIGGEEFVVVMPRTNVYDAERLATKLQRILEDAVFPCRDTGLTIRASFGVATYDHTSTREELLSRADRAMYMQKRSRATVVKLFGNSR